MPSAGSIPSATRKKVVVRRLDGEVVKGYMEIGGTLAPAAQVLDREGRLVDIPMGDIKGIYFVRDFEGDSNRQERKVFSARPRMSGIWVRMTFKDSEVMEGLLSNDLLEADPTGFMITPPDFYSNNMRIFVPRSALGAVKVLGVISDESARRAAKRTRRPPRKAGEETRQIRLFPTESAPDSK